MTSALCSATQMHDEHGHSVDARQARQMIQYLDDIINLMQIQIRTRQDGGYLPFADTLPPAQDEEEDGMMAKISSSSGDEYAHLRANAAAQKQTTVDRLRQAIAQLEVEGRPVNTFTIKEVGGLDYMTYYRNREAFQLFQEHSTHLRKEREQEQAKRQATSRTSKEKEERDKKLLTRPRWHRAIRCWTTSGLAWSNSYTWLVLNVTRQNNRRE